MSLMRAMHGYSPQKQSTGVVQAQSIADGVWPGRAMACTEGRVRKRRCNAGQHLQGRRCWWRGTRSTAALEVWIDSTFYSGPNSRWNAMS